MGTFQRVDWYCTDLSTDRQGRTVVYVYNYKTGRYIRQLRNDKLSDFIHEMARKNSIKKLSCIIPVRKSSEEIEKEREKAIKEREDQESIHSAFGYNPNSGKMETKHCKALVNANKRYAARGNSKTIVYHKITFNI